MYIIMYIMKISNKKRHVKNDVSNVLISIVTFALIDFNGVNYSFSSDSNSSKVFVTILPCWNCLMLSAKTFMLDSQ